MQLLIAARRHGSLRLELLFRPTFGDAAELPIGKT